MSTRQTPAPRLAADLADDLVSAGLISADQQHEAAQLLAARLPAQPPEHSTRAGTSRLAAELAGYLGGILVVAAAAVFIASQWSRMSPWGRVLALLLSAAVLAVASFAVRRTVPADDDAPSLAREARMLLASTLGVAAAAVAGGAVGTWGVQVLDLVEPAPQRLGFAAACLLMVIVYAVAPTGIAHVGIATTAALTALTIVMTLDPPEHASFILAAMLLGLAVLWVLLTERGPLRERVLGRAVAGAIAVIGAQTAIGDGDPWIAYLLLAVVGILAFVLYARTRSWPYLGAGVVALTLSATEAAIDVSDGALGAAGVLLVAGAALLLASAVGFRLGAKGGHQPPPAAT